MLLHWFDDWLKLLPAHVPEDSYEWPDPLMLQLDWKLKKQCLPGATKSFVKTDLLANRLERTKFELLQLSRLTSGAGKKYC